MKSNNIKVLVYAFIAVIIVIILAITIPKFFTKTDKKPGTTGEDQKYKIVKQSKSDKIIYDYKNFSKDFIKVGFDEATCNDEEIQGMQPIICNGQRTVFPEKEVRDNLSLTFNAELVETMGLSLKYGPEEFKADTVIADAKNVVGNLVNLKIDEEIIKDLAKEIVKVPTELGVSKFKDAGNYRLFYNMKFVSGNEINPSYYETSIVFYLKSSIVDLDTPITEEETSQESEQSIMDR